MMRGHLHSRNIYVQRRRLRASLHRVDSNGIAARRLFTISRRRYNVPSPNYLWHIDGTHKLIKWKLVVHAGIDGYSRLIVYCRCSANNRSTTVLRLFEEGVATYGLPLKVRTDHGGENSRVWSLMLEKYLNTNAVLVGSSIHNQRIERFNRDINTQVLNSTSTCLCIWKRESFLIQKMRLIFTYFILSSCQELMNNWMSFVMLIIIILCQLFAITHHCNCIQQI